MFAQYDLADLRKLLDGAGITYGVIHTIDEMPDDRQMRDAEAIVPFADGSGETVSSPFNLDGETKTAPRQAPDIGQHTDEVLSEAGYSAADIQRLRDSKAVA